MTIKHKLFLFIKLPLRLRIKHFIINAHYLFKTVICHFLKSQFLEKVRFLRNHLATMVRSRGLNILHRSFIRSFVWFGCFEKKRESDATVTQSDENFAWLITRHVIEILVRALRRLYEYKIARRKHFSYTFSINWSQRTLFLWQHCNKEIFNVKLSFERLQPKFTEGNL